MSTEWTIVPGELILKCNLTSVTRRIKNEIKTSLTMDFGSQLKIVSRINKRTNINCETTKTNWHLLQDSDNMIHVDRPLEVESITSIDINPGTWKC